MVVFDGRESIYDRAKNFYELLGELARFAGPVHVVRLDSSTVSAADALAREFMKSFDAWPTWWPAETERLNAERRERWFRLRADATGERVSAAA